MRTYQKFVRLLTRGELTALVKLLAWLSLFFSILFLNSANAQSFNHPGAMHSLKDLNFIKQQIQDNKQPWRAAYNQLIGSSVANVHYTHKAFETVECGLFNKPNVGCNRMVDDGKAAYSMALRWFVTGDQRYADKSIEIINDWSQTYRKNTEANAQLVVSWAAPWYVNAAEILRYTDSGWSTTNTNRLNSMLNRFKDYIFFENNHPNNWMMSAIEARLAIAVFQNDRKAFDAAISRWKFRVRTYIYQTSDGPNPVVPTGRTLSRTISDWKSGSTNLKFVNGLCMETCRDLNHTKLGFESLMNGAEIAWQQGVDLFDLEKKRLADFLNLHGDWMTGGNVPNNICDGELDFKGTVSSSRSAFEIAYNHLHDRLGISLNTTREMIDAKRPQSLGTWVRKWEALGYADRPFSTADNAAPTVAFLTPSSNLTVQQGERVTVEVHADDVDGQISNVKLFADSKLVRQESVRPYEWGHAGSPNPGELSGLSIGNHTIKAVATDNRGKSSEATFRLTVQANGGNNAPNVFFLSPTDNLTVNPGYSLTIEAGANDSDGSIANVKLFIDNQLLRQESFPPYEWGGHSTSPDPNELNGLSAGVHTITIEATDNSGKTARDSIELTVNGGGSNTSCHTYSGTDRQEINLSSKKCIQVAGGLSGKTIQVWDSDTNTSCNFRGSVESSNGNGVSNVNANYISITGFSGSSLRFSSSNGCNFLKFRAF